MSQNCITKMLYSTSKNMYAIQFFIRKLLNSLSQFFHALPISDLYFSLK